MYPPVRFDSSSIILALSFILITNLQDNYHVDIDDHYLRVSPRFWEIINGPRKIQVIQEIHKNRNVQKFNLNYFLEIFSFF